MVRACSLDLIWPDRSTLDIIWVFVRYPLLVFTNRWRHVLFTFVALIPFALIYSPFLHPLLLLRGLDGTALFSRATLTGCARLGKGFVRRTETKGTASNDQCECQ